MFRARAASGLSLMLRGFWVSDGAPFTPLHQPPVPNPYQPASSLVGQKEIHYNKDPKRDHNFDNHPYLFLNQLLFLDFRFRIPRAID